MSSSKKSGVAPESAAVLEVVLNEQRNALKAVGDDVPQHVLDDTHPVDGDEGGDADDFFEVHPEDVGDGVNPVAAAARERVLAAFRKQVALREQVARRGEVVALVVDDIWAEDVVAAYYSVVHDGSVPSRDRYRARGEGQRPIAIYTKIGDSPASVRDHEQRLGDALSARRGAVVAVADIAHLTPGVRLAVDAVLEAPVLDDMSLIVIASRIGSVSSVPQIDPAFPARIEPRHLGLAVRPDDTAEAFVARLVRIVNADTAGVAKKMSAPRWTLDNLPLPALVESWGRQLVADLGEYRAGRLSWADVDRGALLAGPPGCGKTTFAGALAASAEVPLIVGGYSRWDSGDDGKSDYRTIIKSMRKTFADARRAAPCVLFLDEVDSFVARGQAGHNESWFAPIMNALLSELDGAEGREGVVVVAATNNPAAIDPALRRAGRLDRELELSLPGQATLARILREHLGGADLDYFLVTRRLQGASGVDCERLARGARRRARAAGRAVEIGDLLEEMAPDEQLSPEQRKRVAVHEAGHALVAAVERPGTLQGVSLSVPGTPGAAGMSWGTGPASLLQSLGDLEFRVRRLLAGRAAEVLVLGAPWAGSGGTPDSDLAQATATAASIEGSYGLGGGSLVYRGVVTGGNVDNVLAIHRDLLEPVHHRLEAADRAVTDILRRHRAALQAVADALLQREALTGAEVEGIVAAHPPVERSVLCEVPRIPAVPRKGGVR